MPGFEFNMNRGRGYPSPVVMDFLIGRSTQIHVGDVLVFTTASAYTAGPRVIRPFLSSDDPTTAKGYVGVSLANVRTDANANLLEPPSTVNVDARARVSYQLPSIAHSFPKDPASGYFRVPVAVFAPEAVFAARMQSDDIANFTQVGKKLWIRASGTTPPITYDISDDAVPTGASVESVVCVGVEVTDRLFNQNGGLVYVSLLPTFWSVETGANYTT